jgi:uncharacterized protein YjiS (DUF1127 family)
MRRNVVIEKLIRVAKVIRVRFNAHWAARDTVKELSRLSDKDLNDIGLCRGDIHYIANKHYDDIIERMNGKKVPLYDKMPEGILDI